MGRCILSFRGRRGGSKSRFPSPSPGRPSLPPALLSIRLFTPPSLYSLREEILTILQEIKIQPLKVPILNHWTIKPLRREEIKDFLSQEIGRPVYWIRCVEKLLHEGYTQFIEVGHETTLTKLMRWIDREAEAFSAGEHLTREDVR